MTFSILRRLKVVPQIGLRTKFKINKTEEEKTSHLTWPQCVLLGFLGILLDQSVFASRGLSEADLVTLAKNQSTATDGFEAEAATSKIALSRYYEKFSGYLSGSAGIEKSTEPSFSNPSPDSTTTAILSSQYQQNLDYGLSVSGGLFHNRASFSGFPLDTYNTTGLNLGFKMDLSKNLWGELDNLNELALKLDDIKMKDVKHLKTAEFVQSVRSLYWQIVANQEIQKLRQKIIESVTKQEKQIRAQSNLFVSDESDVTRFSSLKELQKSSLIMLKYSREQLEFALKSMLPSLRSGQVSFEIPDLDSASLDVSACIGSIATETNVPARQSTWTRVIAAVSRSAEAKKSANATYDDFDLSFEANVRLSQHSPETDLPIDAEDEDSHKLSMALVMTYPVGSEKLRTKRWQDYATEKAKIAESDRYRAALETTHNKTVRLIGLLNQALRAQGTVNSLNQKNLRLVKQKYARAELPLVQLIEDETNLLAGKISELETKLLIINTVIDYLKVFDKYDCRFNRVGKL